MSRDTVVVHPSSNSNVVALLRGVHRSGRLRAFHTSLTFSARSPVTSIVRAIVPNAVLSLSAKRVIPDELVPFIRQHPTYEIYSRLRGGDGVSSPHALYAFIGRRAAAAIRDASIANVVAYEDGAAEVFEVDGLKKYYDLPIPYWKSKHFMLEEEASRNPRWSNLLGGLTDSPRMLDRKVAEMELSDVVLTASSVTTRSVLDSFPKKRILQFAYGAPPTSVPSAREPRPGPLRVLFVGGLTQRKGLSYLFDAINRMGSSVTLTVVGSRMGPTNPDLERELLRHRYLDVLSRDRVRAEMAESDVLVLPSIVEGYGLVILEALAAGIPVITTNRTGAADLFSGPSTAWIVPVGSSEAITHILTHFRDNPDQLHAAKVTALNLARENSWESYISHIDSEFAGA